MLFRLFTIALVLLAAPSASAADVDPRAWTELDIVPMPKRLRLTERDLALSPRAVAIVVGAGACRQSRIGADWINKRLAALGGDALAISAAPPPDRTALIVGTVDDNPLIARAARDKTVRVGKADPGERGYEIRRSADGRRVYLAGADPLGALYACVTFGELVQRRGDRVPVPSPAAHLRGRRLREGDSSVARIAQFSTPPRSARGGESAYVRACAAPFDPRSGAKFTSAPLDNTGPDRRVRRQEMPRFRRASPDAGQP